MRLGWEERGGGDFLDLSGTGPEGDGTWLAVRPHEEQGYYRPLCVLVPGEEARELGDGVLGREHARDTIVKYAIRTLAEIHGVPATRLESGEDDPWAARAIAALWTLLADAPHST